MPNRFGRVYRLKIGDFETTELRLQFEVTKSLVGYPNTANIKVTNPNETSQQIIAEGGPVELYTGYNDSPVLLFSGCIVNSIPHFAQPDFVYEIYAGDKADVLAEATINKTLAPGATTETIFNELVSKMDGVAKGATEGIKNCLSGKQSLLRSLQLTGNVKDWLKKISEDCGFDYSVNDGVIETTVKNQPLSDELPYIVNQKYGMIGSPERSDIGVNVKVLMEPALKLGRKFKVESLTEKINAGNLFFKPVPAVKNAGVYRIDKLIHRGDTHDNEWSTEINGRIF